MEKISKKGSYPKSQPPVLSLSLRSKFQIGTGAFLVIVCLISAFLIYHHEKASLQEVAYAKTELVMAAVEAGRTYVREELRPRMFAEYGPDFFMLEAMSTSYVGRAVMDRFGQAVPDYRYRRVSINARNPQSEADALERQMIDYFRQNPERDNWQGLTEKNGRPHFMRFQPVFFDTSCMHCHGVPSDAPAELLRIYGDTNGFGHFPGELAGITAVDIPADSALADIKEKASTVFIALLLGVSVFFLFMISIFDRIVVSNLQGVLDIFRTSLDNDPQPNPSDPISEKDELLALTAAAKTMAAHLHHNREVLVQKNLELDQKKELLQSVFDGITDMVVLLDKNLRIKMVNKAYLRKYHVAFEDVYNVPCYEAHSGNQEVCAGCAVSTVAEAKTAVTKEIRYAGGELYLVNFYPVFDDSGCLESIIRYSREITDQKKVELKIQQAEKLVAIGQLAAGVAHEINNPLGVILCYTDLLKRELANFPQGFKDLGVIEKQALNSKRIVTDLLQFARSHESAKQAAVLNSIINEVIQFMVHQFKKQEINVALELGDDLPLIHMDMNKMKQVLINLLMNACQAINGRGEIVVSSACLSHEKQVEIKVWDNGLGIDPAIRTKIFDPFFTTKASGESTGLGLSVSYGIIQDHGGEITVESEPGQWTCFTIRLPCD
jgi:nitrogen-specific signal transduction histidine kinase